MSNICNSLNLQFLKQKTIAFLIGSLIWILLSSSFLKYIIWIRVSALLILLMMVAVLIRLSNLNKTFFTLSSLFIVFLNIFHFGNIFIVMINPNYNFMVYSFANRTTQLSSVIAAINFCVITTIFIYFGILYQSSYHKIKNIPFKKFCLTLKELKVYSVIIILISFPIQMYIDINKLLLAFSSNYLATYNFTISGVLIQIGSFYIIGFVMLMIANKQNSKSTIIYLFIILYQCINMLSGNRARQVLSILIISYIYFFLMKKISFTKKNIKKFILLIIPVYILINGIVNISSFRTDISSNPFAFIQSCIIPQKNIIIAILDEFGYTLYTVVLEMERLSGFGMGLTYVGSFMTIFPTIFSFQEQVLSFSNFVAHLKYGGIGGTIIGELYYNFSWLGSIFGCMIGFFIGWISMLFNTSYKDNRMFLFSFLIIPAISVLWWIRDSFLNIPRMVVYEIVFLFILFFLSKHITKFFNKDVGKDNDNTKY